ncbi:arginase [Rhizobiales bacterium GAS191]|nr:arginase [Rhizobiales bacterium GAS191]
MNAPMTLQAQLRAAPPVISHRVGLLGVPLDLGSATAGALMGPAALRTAGLAGLLAELGHQVSDHGDMAAPQPASPSLAPIHAERCRNLDRIAGWIRAIHDRAYDLARSGELPVFLGGDHSLSMGTISGIARHCAESGKELALLWIDAHADFNTPETTRSGNMHGMSLAFLSGEGSLDGLLGHGQPLAAVPTSNIHIFGARSIDPDERVRLRQHGVDCVDMRQIDEFGVAPLLRERIDAWQRRDLHLHVSLDVDFLDPEVAPGVGTTVPGGATYREAHLIMEMLCDSGLIGSLDIVELNPFLDVRGRSAVVLAELVASLFGRTVLDRLQRPPVSVDPDFLSSEDVS